MKNERQWRLKLMSVVKLCGRDSVFILVHMCRRFVTPVIVVKTPS